MTGQSNDRQVSDRQAGDRQVNDRQASDRASRQPGGSRAVNADRLRLTDGECRAYCRQAGIAPGKPTLAYLQDILDKVLSHTCYSNLAMLLRTPRRAPSRDEIVADMLSGAGGVCISANVFVQSLLVHLGFDSRLVPGYKRQWQAAHPGPCYQQTVSPGAEPMPCWRQELLDSQPKLMHIGIQVRLGAARYYMDAGNGYPYFALCRFDSGEEHQYGGLGYRLMPGDDKGFHALQHKSAAGSEYGCTRFFCTDMLVADQPVGLSHFAEMSDQHCTDANFSHLLKCLRLIKCSRQGMYALRHDPGATALIVSEGGRVRRKTLSVDQLTRLAERKFPAATGHIAQAVRAVELAAGRWVRP